MNSPDITGLMNLFSFLAKGMIKAPNGRVSISKLLFLIALATISALLLVATRMTAFVAHPEHKNGISPEEFNLVRMCVGLIFIVGFFTSCTLVLTNFMNGVARSRKYRKQLHSISLRLQTTATLMRSKQRSGRLSQTSKSNIIAMLISCRKEIQALDFPAKEGFSVRLQLVITNLAEPAARVKCVEESFQPKRSWPNEFVEFAIGDLDDLAATLGALSYR